MNKKLGFNILFWLFIWLLFSFSFMRFETVTIAFRLSALVIAPMIIPVYIHDYLFDYFIIRKNYVLYAICVVFLVVFFGYLIGQFQHFIEPEGDSETYGAMIFFMLLYTGSRYFRLGAQQRIKIKEEEDRRLKAELELRELGAKQAHAELDLLKSQVNPHFLFNSLNSIYSLILDKNEIAAQTVMKLSELMRYLLQSSGKRKVLVKHEIEFLSNYIDLEKIRLGKKARVNFGFHGDAEGKIISPMLLIPFVENCFKHGIGIQPEQNIINISIEIWVNKIILKTSNPAALKRIDPEKKKTGTGIENVRKRLEMLYPRRHQMNIKSENNIFETTLEIEL